MHVLWSSRTFLASSQGVHRKPVHIIVRLNRISHEIYAKLDLAVVAFSIDPRNPRQIFDRFLSVQGSKYRKVRTYEKPPSKLRPQNVSCRYYQVRSSQVTIPDSTVHEYVRWILLVVLYNTCCTGPKKMTQSGSSAIRKIAEMLKFPKKEKSENGKKRWKEREKKGKKEGEKGFGIEWSGK